MDGYDRDKFPHWIDQGDGCDTREAVLKRDGYGVETGSDCYPTSGSWTSPYDDETWTDPPTSTSTTWCRSPRPGPPAPASGRRTSARSFANDLEHLPAPRGHGQREPVEERPGPGGVDAAEDRLPLHVRADVGLGEEHLPADAGLG